MPVEPQIPWENKAAETPMSLAATNPWDCDARMTTRLWDQDTDMKKHYLEGISSVQGVL